MPAATPWSIFKALDQHEADLTPENEALGEESSALRRELPARWKKVCKACAEHGQANDHFNKFFQTLWLQAWHQTAPPTGGRQGPTGGMGTALVEQ
eukprot:g29794.t1